MSDLRLDWRAISMDLARHLRSVADSGLIRRMLDDAEQDAVCLDAPADFWSTVLSNYDHIAAPEGGAETAHVRALIEARARR